MKIGVIGAGNMASALIEGFISAEIVAPADIFLSDTDESKLSVWSERGVSCCKSNPEAVQNADMVIFAVKPAVLEGVLSALGECPKNKIYVSIAAGFPISRIEKIIGSDAKIIRVMPNTPALVRCGMSVLCSNPNVTDGEMATASELFSSVGEVVCLDEKYINAATAIHSSSPAFIYMLIDAMADAGVKYGIGKKEALTLAAKAVEGSAKMVLMSDKCPMELKDNVCSPAGTTIEAVLELERNGFRSDIQSAIKVCTEKADSMMKN